MRERNRLPEGRLFTHVYIGHSFQFQRFRHRDFNDDSICLCNIGRRIADGGCRNKVSVFCNRESLDQSDIRFSDMTGCDKFRRAAEVHVDIADIACVDGFSQNGIGLIRNTLSYNSGFGKFRVHFRTDGSAGIEVDFNLSSCLCLLGKSMRNRFRITCIGKTADSDSHAVFNHICSIFRRADKGKCTFVS